MSNLFVDPYSSTQPKIGHFALVATRYFPVLANFVFFACGRASLLGN